MRPIRLGVVLAVLAGGAISPAAALAANTWAGVWNSDFGRLTMDAGGAGNYEGFNPGTVSGGVSGNVNQGTWNQPGDPPKKGTYKFTLSGDGRSFSGEWAYESGGCGTACGWNGTCIEGPCMDNSISGAAVSPGKAVAKAGRVSGEVRYRTGNGQWRPLGAGASLGANQEIATGVDASVTLTFPDGTRMEIDEMSQVALVVLSTEGSRQTVRVSVELGRLDATVNPQKAFQSDFKVDVTTGRASVRGTKFSIFHDAVAKATLLSVTQGVVGWDPVAPGLADVSLTVGQEIEATAAAVTAPAGIGSAGSIAGINRLRARDLVLARLDKAKRGCRLTTPRSASAVSTTASADAWKVAVKVSGRAKGRSTLVVKGGKVTATNKVARKITRRCR